VGMAELAAAGPPLGRNRCDSNVRPAGSGADVGPPVADDRGATGLGLERVDPAARLGPGRRVGDVREVGEVVQPDLEVVTQEGA